MRKHAVVGALVALALSCLVNPGISWAEKLEVAPSKVATLPQDETGRTLVAVQFDLSGLRQGEGRRIDEAYIEWRVEGLRGDVQSRFAVQEAKEPWTAESVVAGRGAPTLEPVAADAWQIEPKTFARVGNLVRLDIREMARAWASGQRTNCGLVITASEVARSSVAARAGDAKLVVLYGFVR